jgi:hypothetical protein
MSGGWTPGPWDIQAHAYDKRIAVGIGLVEGPNGYDVAEVYADDCDRDEALANARLIAAGPEMVEALRRWMHTGCPNCSGDCGSANPPVMSCIMVETSRLLARIDGGDQ